MCVCVLGGSLLDMCREKEGGEKTWVGLLAKNFLTNFQALRNYFLIGINRTRPDMG